MRVFVLTTYVFVCHHQGMDTPPATPALAIHTDPTTGDVMAWEADGDVITVTRLGTMKEEA